MADQKSHWDNDPEYPPEDWQAEIASGDTRLGYHEWVMNQKGEEIIPQDFGKDLIFLTAYAVDQQYGGPEEGGWWWDRYTFLETRVLSIGVEAAQADAAKEELRVKYADMDDGRPLSSVLSTGRIYILGEHYPGQYTTRRRPHYE